MKQYTFIITPAQNNERLDTICFELFPEYSRSFFQKLIDNGHVKVNERIIKKAGYKVKTSDTIQCTLLLPKTINLSPHALPLNIIFEHPDFLIINKPAGLSVHPSPTNPEEITLVNGLLYYYPEFLAFDSEDRPGIVHRLDKNTSGLLIVARTIQSAITFSTMFKERMVKKKYLALVHGHTDQQGRIDFPIGRDIRERHKMTHLNPLGKHALTYFHALRYFSNNTLLSVEIITGRTHQIRVHCAAIGHPILGDATYGQESPLLPRQALHAAECTFTYKEIEYHFTTPLPKDIEEVLETLIPYKN